VQRTGVAAAAERTSQSSTHPSEASALQAISESVSVEHSPCSCDMAKKYQLKCNNEAFVASNYVKNKSSSLSYEQ
jgi:hypothetical protein